MPRQKVIANAKRVVIKCGTSTVMDVDTGLVNIVNVSNVVQEAAKLRRSGIEVVIVSSGAVGLGRDLVRRSDRNNGNAWDDTLDKTSYNHAFAAAGQGRLVHLYTTLFDQLNVASSQILVTQHDFQDKSRLSNLTLAVNTLLKHGIIPIMNENDAVTANRGYTPEDAFSDNDGLAALVSTSISADVLICLTDVPGVLSHPPGHPMAKRINFIGIDTIGNLTRELNIGEATSGVSRGGMRQKIQCAIDAVKSGVPGVFIIDGAEGGSITRAMLGQDVGTLISSHSEDVERSLEDMATAVRSGGQILSSQLTSAQRKQILIDIAGELWNRRTEILDANKEDLRAADANSIALALRNRLTLTESKLKDLSKGIVSIASGEEPLGRDLSRTRIAKDLLLTKRTCPIGVVLVIFESRPDSLPQIAALSIASGNGLILKGGKEAEHSNRILHKIIVDTLHQSTHGVLPRETIALVETRAHIRDLLQLAHVIDLVIPRGSNQLVRSIQESTKIPVLGHADGICHVYIDRTANPMMAEKIAIDAKTNYPAACNAMETLLLDTQFGDKERLLGKLKDSGVSLYFGPCLLKDFPNLVESYCSGPAESFKVEYGELECCVEVVDGVTNAIAHINIHGSHHTDAIVCQDAATWNAFDSAVASACVFHNASTRFADGFRFGLGAEVGISTSMIHARGPVGVEGLQSEKWSLETTTASRCYTVTDIKPEEYLFTDEKQSSVETG